MVPGNTYLVQVWVNDGRNIGESRSETITGGTNTSAPVSFGSDGSGPGQYIIGTFVADSLGSQTLILTPFSSGLPGSRLTSSSISCSPLRIIARKLPQRRLTFHNRELSVRLNAPEARE